MRVEKLGLEEVARAFKEAMPHCQIRAEYALAADGYMVNVSKVVNGREIALNQEVPRCLVESESLDGIATMISTAKRKMEVALGAVMLDAPTDGARIDWSFEPPEFTTLEAPHMSDRLPEPKPINDIPENPEANSW
jgi:hypothetical protein